MAMQQQSQTNAAVSTSRPASSKADTTATASSSTPVQTNITVTTSLNKSKTKYNNNAAAAAAANTSKVMIPPYQKDTRKLFVGGLGKQVNNQNFKQYFEQFGTILDSVVMIDRDTNRHRGFGFVTFQDPNASLQVLASGNKGKICPPGGFRSGRIDIYGKICEVKASEPKKGSRSTGRSTCSSDSSDVNKVPNQIHIQFQAGYDAQQDVGMHNGTSGMGIEYGHYAANMGQVNPFPYNCVPAPYPNGAVYYPPYGVPHPNFMYNPYGYYQYPHGAASGMAPMAAEQYYYAPADAYVYYPPSATSTAGDGPSVIPERQMADDYKQE
jgi:RNA recognition motif-containing protein